MTVFPYATYALVAFAGVMLIPAALECGMRYGWLAYVSSACLAMFITPDVEAKWLYLLFFGYYPLVHMRLQLWQNVFLSWVVRLMLFNAAIVSMFWVCITFLGVPKAEFTIPGIYMPWILLVLGNVVFLIYDRMLVRLGVLYRVRLHPLFLKFWR